MSVKTCTATDLLAKGGAWLGRLRDRVKWRGGNGERVTWGSGDILSPPVSIGELECLAAEAVAADRNRSSPGKRLLAGEVVTLCSACSPVDGPRSRRWLRVQCGHAGSNCVDVRIEAVAEPAGDE